MAKSYKKAAGDTDAQYDDPLHDPKYKVLHHDLPPENDLGAHLRLLESFERRLMHTAEAGSQWIKPHTAEDVDRVISERTAAYGEVQDAYRKAFHGNILCIALLERGLEAAKEHIQRRIDGEDPGSEALKRLEKKVEEDLMAGMSLRSELKELGYNLRRKGGHLDRDDVVGEMIGEPYKIFIGTLPGKHPVLEAFQTLRARKEACAMKCIDQVIDAAQKLSHAFPEYEAAAMDKKLENLRNWSKKRVQLQVTDKDFMKTHEQMLLARNMVHDFELAKNDDSTPSNLPADHRSRANKASLNSLVLLREAADIVSDITHIRGERTHSARFYEARVKEELSRCIGTGTPGGGGLVA